MEDQRIRKRKKCHRIEVTMMADQIVTKKEKRAVVVVVLVLVETARLHSNFILETLPTALYPLTYSIILLKSMARTTF